MLQHVAYIAIVKNDKCKDAIWEHIALQYNLNRSNGGGERLARLLETKRGTVK
jgi:hypothetical protein